jgi:hypothetical protein
MFKRYFTLILTVLVFNLFLGTSAFANTKEDKFAAKIKTNITKLGTGAEARVEVKLRDKTKLKGYVSRISENSFTVVDEKTGNASEVPYSSAKQVKGNNLSTGVTIVIVVAIVLAIGAIVGACCAQ